MDDGVKYSAAAIDRRMLLAVAAATGGLLALPSAATAQDAPRRGGTLRWAIPFNSGSLDPDDRTHGGRVRDPLYNVRRAGRLRSAHARPEAWSGEIVDVPRPEGADAGASGGRDVSRWHAVQCRGGEVQSRPLPAGPALERQGRHQHGARGDRRRPAARDFASQRTERSASGNPDGSRRDDGVTHEHQGERTQRRPPAGRHRSFHIRQHAGQ